MPDWIVSHAHTAGAGLRIRRIGGGTGRRRLPRRGRCPLLLSALPARPRLGGRARDAHDSRGERIASHAQCAFQGRHGGRAHAAGTPRHGRLECVGVDGEGRIRGAALRAADTMAAGPKPESTASTVVAWGAAARAKVRHRPTSGATRP